MMGSIPSLPWTELLTFRETQETYLAFGLLNRVSQRVSLLAFVALGPWRFNILSSYRTKLDTFMVM